MYQSDLTQPLCASASLREIIGTRRRARCYRFHNNRHSVLKAFEKGFHAGPKAARGQHREGAKGCEDIVPARRAIMTIMLSCVPNRF
jgi:hypothetical protein